MKRSINPIIAVDVVSKTFKVITGIMHPTAYGKDLLNLDTLKVVETTKGLHYEYKGLWYKIDAKTEFVYA